MLLAFVTGDATRWKGPGRISKEILIYHERGGYYRTVEQPDGLRSDLTSWYTHQVFVFSFCRGPPSLTKAVDRLRSTLAKEAKKVEKTEKAKRRRRRGRRRRRRKRRKTKKAKGWGRRGKRRMRGKQLKPLLNILRSKLFLRYWSHVSTFSAQRNKENMALFLSSAVF